MKITSKDITQGGVNLAIWQCRTLKVENWLQNHFSHLHGTVYLDIRGENTM